MFNAIVNAMRGSKYGIFFIYVHNIIVLISYRKMMRYGPKYLPEKGKNNILF